MMSQQFPLFVMDEVKPQTPQPLELLRKGASLVLSVSGGKDSDAMSHHLLDLRQAEGWSGDVCMVHADLGKRVEWHQTPDYVKNLAKRKDVPLHVVRWKHGDLIDRIWQRYYKDPSRSCWPSSSIRYCTSDMKRGPISRWIRNHFQRDVLFMIGYPFTIGRRVMYGTAFVNMVMLLTLRIVWNNPISVYHVLCVSLQASMI
jgi:3'-phosphoadenosine 5'-phosphosulfate sulfotransferase (PAPS reductase)/FAD synthetase